MPPTVDQLELGPIGTNTYLVRAEPSATEAVVIDPSGDVPAILNALERARARCAAILVTHGHFDHVIGLAELAEETGAPVHAPEGERALLEHPEAFTPAGLVVRPCGVANWLRGGETIDAAGLSFQVRLVPGHSPGHVAYAVDGVLFAGDVLFAGSVGRTDLPGGDWELLSRSIGSLVAAHPGETIVYPGHGPATTLGAELARNPFLDAIRAARGAS